MNVTGQAQSRMIPLTAVCLKLGLSWPQVWRLALRGELGARKEGGRWLCDADRVEQVRRDRVKASRGTA